MRICFAHGGDATSRGSCCGAGGSAVAAVIAFAAISAWELDDEAPCCVGGRDAAPGIGLAFAMFEPLGLHVSPAPAREDSAASSRARFRQVRRGGVAVELEASEARHGGGVGSASGSGSGTGNCSP